MQHDGNLVEYAGQRPSPVGDPHTDNNPGAYAAMQNDGNLVVYLAASALMVDRHGRGERPLPCCDPNGCQLRRLQSRRGSDVGVSGRKVQLAGTVSWTSAASIGQARRVASATPLSASSNSGSSEWT